MHHLLSLVANISAFLIMLALSWLVKEIWQFCFKAKGGQEDE